LSDTSVLYFSAGRLARTHQTRFLTERVVPG